MKNESNEHAEWLEDLMDDVRTLRDDRGIVRPHLLERLTNEERFELADCGAYTAPELWPQAHNDVGFAAAYEWFTAPDGPSMAQKVSECCAGCWSTLVAGIEDYERFIARLAAELVAAARSDHPVIPPPHVCHAVSRFLDSMPAGSTLADLSARADGWHTSKAGEGSEKQSHQAQQNPD